MPKHAFNYLAWLLAVGVYLLIRLWGTAVHPPWASSNTSIIFVWLAVPAILTTFFSLSLAITNNASIRKLTYGLIIIVRVIVLIAGLLVALFLLGVISVISGEFTANELAIKYMAGMRSPEFISASLYFVSTAFILSFVNQMSYMIGPRVLLNIILGKYHYPKEEVRIFMFLDMRDSTSHAEKLGHKQFSRLIQDCFHHLTDSIIKNDVEIYQYVGDEAILTWNIDNGVHNAKCIRAYRDFASTLQHNRDYYLNEYGIFPEFKAGINAGGVTVAEIGDLKREITYLSDVLNTAARIQSLCNTLKEPVLISEPLQKLLINNGSLEFISHGKHKLKGKEGSLEIFGIRWTD